MKMLIYLTFLKIQSLLCDFIVFLLPMFLLHLGFWVVNLV